MNYGKFLGCNYAMIHLNYAVILLLSVCYKLPVSWTIHVPLISFLRMACIEEANPVDVKKIRIAI
jgi:type IV secretory pathway VirB3-like protein